MTSKQYDLLLRNVRVVRPGQTTVDTQDIAVKDGKFARVQSGIPADTATEVVDGRGRLAFPGLVDPHMHCGIYAPLAEDAVTESRAAAQGGVTSSINYFRTGHYYLNKGGPYADFFPEVKAISDGRFHVDYAYHLAPMDRTHIAEIPMLIDKHGVTSFKIYMFYGGYGLHGASNQQHEFLMIDEEEKYDIAHFEFVMRGIQRAMEMYPDRKDVISLSLHCETAEIMAAYTKLVVPERAGPVTSTSPSGRDSTFRILSPSAPSKPSLSRLGTSFGSMSRIETSSPSGVGVVRRCACFCSPPPARTVKPSSGSMPGCSKARCRRRATSRLCAAGGRSTTCWRTPSMR